MRCLALFLVLLSFPSFGSNELFSIQSIEAGGESHVILELDRVVSSEICDASSQVLIRENELSENSRKLLSLALVTGRKLIFSFQECYTGSTSIRHPLITHFAISPTAGQFKQPTVISYWSPKTVALGAEQTYFWESENTDKCVSDNGTVREVSGSDGPYIAETLGSFTARITCTGPGGSVTSEAPRIITYKLPIVSSYWSPNTVAIGQEQTYFWEATNADKCVSDNGTIREISGSDGPYVAETLGSSIARITCTGPGGSVTSEAPRTITPPAPIVNSSWSPQNVLLGASQVYSWNSSYAASCVGDNGVVREHSGSVTVVADTIGDFIAKITCSGPGGATTSEAPRTVSSPPPTVNSSWSPQNVLLGASQVYSWTSTNAASCVGDNGDIREPSGSETVVADTAGSFVAQITCTGPGGSATSSAPRTVTHPATTVSSWWSPQNVISGQQQTYYWRSTNATRCVSDNGTVRAVSGSETTIAGGAGSFTARITCSGPGGSASSLASRTIQAPPPPSVSSSWSPQNIKLGQQQTYSWSASNATHCISGNGTRRGTSGSVGPVVGTSAGNFTASITCYGAGGSAISYAPRSISAN